MTRHDEMMNFLNNHLSTEFSIASLAADASFRRYYRIHVKLDEHDKDEMTYLLMDAPPDKERVTEFVKVAGIISDALNVPNISPRHYQGFFIITRFWHNRIFSFNQRR